VGPRAGLNGCAKSRPPLDFFYSFVLCTSSVLVALSRFSSILPFVFTYKTNIHAPGGIRTHNASNRSAADPRIRPLGHWDRRIRSPDRPARS
jgi:hypothetical protein